MSFIPLCPRELEKRRGPDPNTPLSREEPCQGGHRVAVVQRLTVGREKLIFPFYFSCAICLVLRLVKLSVKSDYAARAVLALARTYQMGEAQKAEDLARAHGIPANYLVQILIELKSQQIVRSLRGKQGGYLLARAPTEISLGDVLRCVHGEVFDSPALNDAQCPPELRRAWKKLQQTMDGTADAINFGQLVEEGLTKAKMYYI